MILICQLNLTNYPMMFVNRFCLFGEKGIRLIFFRLESFPYHILAQSREMRRLAASLLEAPVVLSSCCVVVLEVMVRDFDQIDSHEAASRDASASFFVVGSSASRVPLEAGASLVPCPEAHSQHSAPRRARCSRGCLQAPDFGNSGMWRTPGRSAQHKLLGTASQHACSSTSSTREWHAERPPLA